MNFFFGVKSKDIKSRLIIPRFQNKNETNSQYSLFRVDISNGRWQFTQMIECEINEHFFKLQDDDLDNKKIYCLTNQHEIKKMKINNFKKLLPLNNFTITSPAYRANLELSLHKGGFSSYQSEYPFSMIKKKGNILSPINSLTNINANENILFFKNIYELPINEEFEILLVNVKKKTIIEKFKVYTNMTNEIKILKDYIGPDIYFYSKNYIGIPIFMSINNKHISLEHTHPPHEYILSEDKYKIISKKKKEINDFIN